MDKQTHKKTDTWTNRQMDKGAQMDMQTNGQFTKWTNRLFKIITPTEGQMKHIFYDF